jgi:endoglucanase
VADSDLDKAIAQTAKGEDLPAMITWRRTDVAAKMSLALLAAEPQRARYRAQLIAAANVVVQHALTEGYRVPHAPTQDGRYVWGSNSFILNNMLVLASAYDFSGKDEFRAATIWGMDYLLGRNARGQSYVTGYGERPAENPHHRFWAYQADARSPKPPPGVVVGGPNSDLQDPYVKAAGRKGCAPQKCYIDHIEAWSQNEVAINWNAPLYWTASWLNERHNPGNLPVETPKRGD